MGGCRLPLPSALPSEGPDIQGLLWIFYNTPRLGKRRCRRSGRLCPSTGSRRGQGAGLALPPAGFRRSPSDARPATAPYSAACPPWLLSEGGPGVGGAHATASVCWSVNRIGVTRARRSGRGWLRAGIVVVRRRIWPPVDVLGRWSGRAAGPKAGSRSRPDNAAPCAPGGRPLIFVKKISTK